MADLKDLASRYGVLKDKLNAQDFEPNDSVIVSSLMHPQEAARRAKDAFMRSIDAAGGVPREILDESSVFPFGIAPSIDEQAQAGLDLAGLMQTGAMPFAPASAGGTLGMAIKAYHGTPHLFDQFDMSKIGTGEGAQAYGHGLYFAENPMVAKTYMTAGVPVDEYQNKIFLKKYHADTAKLRGDVERETALLQEIKDMQAQKGGNIYETSIRWPNAEREAMDPLGEHHLLDWDQPLSEQSDYVRNKLKKSDFYKNANKTYKDQKQWYLDPSQKTGESFLKYMRSGYDDEFASAIKDAEQYLKNLDIPGLKYLDATSRSTDKGTRNYVMFGDEYPEIIKRAGSLDELQEKYAQGGIVKAQDQNENLGKLAEMLGSARDVGNQYTVPSWVPLAGGVGAGDLLMGKTPEEIENWSYGNAPMQIPEMSNVPQFKRGRAQSLADALTTLAPGVKATEGLPAGLSFIGPKSKNWDKVAAELAAKKLDEGADPAEVWREHLIGRMPDKTLFSEISDKEMSHVIPLNKWVNRENGQFMAPNISTAWDEAASTLTPNAPVRIKRLFEHDQLKNEYPYGFTKNYENQSIMDMPVFMQEKNSKYSGSLGDGDLTLHPSLLPKEARSTVLHELQHAIQNQEGWGKGGSPEEFQLSDFAKSYWQNIYDKSNDQQSELLQSLLEKKKAGEIDNNDIRLQMESLANRNGRSIAETMLRRDKNSIESYKRLAGEAQARATQDRLDMDMAQRRENYPLAGGKLSDIPLEDLIYKYEGNGPSLSMDPLSKYKDYVGEHSAPLGDSGAPLHDLTANENAIYPSDVYSSQANQYYGSGEPEDAQLFAMAQRLKDKPNEKVSIYRAVPKMQSNSEKIAGLEKDLANYMKRGRMPKNADFDNKSDWYEWASNERDRLSSLPEETLDPLSINHGDWVALDKKYAKEHGESALGGNYKILSKKVPARQLFTNGDSIREWGWDSRYAQGGSVDKDSLQLNKPQRTPSHPDKSHIVKTMVDGKEKIIRFGEQGAETAGKPKEGESDRMTAKRESFKARHAKNIAKGPSSAAYWANKVKWAEGGEVDIMSKLDELAGGGDYLADLEQLKRAYPNATKFFNATQSALEEAVPTTEQMRDPDYLIEHLNPMALSMSAPEKTVNAYKLFRTKANDPDTLYPLFVNADKPVLKDEWIPAEAGAPASQNSDKVKSLLGPLAYRPGWHAGDVPVATHIGKGGKPPVYRPSEHTWAEVEFPDDIDWQTLANERGMNKKGVIVPKFAHITDQLPEGGFYRYKTSPNMTGQWLIGGSMKLGKHLSDDEVKAINEASGLGVEDLPRFHEYLSRNADNPSELSRVINSSAGKDEYFQMLKNARDNEIDDLLKRYSEFTDDKALSAMDKRYNKYLKKGYAEGGEVKDLHNKYEESDYGYGNRPDKTKKGLGYFGELERPDGTGVMTEYSIGVPINGEEMDVPTLIPTLTPDEIRLILHLQEGEDMPRSIVHKAIDHAHQRLSEGKPIFATEEDLYAHGGIVDVLHNDAIEQIMKAFMDSMEDEQEEEEPAAVSIQITTHSQPLKSGKIPTSIREAKHG